MSELILKWRNQHNFENSDYYCMQLIWAVDLFGKLPCATFIHERVLTWRIKVLKRVVSRLGIGMASTCENYTRNSPMAKSWFCLQSWVWAG